MVEEPRDAAAIRGVDRELVLATGRVEVEEGREALLVVALACKDATGTMRGAATGESGGAASAAQSSGGGWALPRRSASPVVITSPVYSHTKAPREMCPSARTAHPLCRVLYTWSDAEIPRWTTRLRQWASQPHAALHS